MQRMFGFLIGIFVGWTVGASIALLLAPESGEKLRGQIRDSGTGFFAQIQNAANSKRIELERELEDLRADPRQSV